MTLGYDSLSYCLKNVSLACVIAMNADYAGGAVIVIGYMLFVSRGVVLYSRTGEAVEAVLRGHTVRAVATLSVAPSSS